MNQQSELRDLQAALRTASDIAFDHDEPAGEQAEVLVDALRRALAAAQSYVDGPGETGCREHPRGAVDPLYGDKDDPLPPGWGKCLLCNDRRRRATRGLRSPVTPPRRPGGRFGPL
ncbi:MULTISPECIES: hypothetical protein [unclassified Streptomyces]|uniref:Uncharacterized protein n=1 Tax=Streptomyces johnsoniae TaxID=3075532 RepID=A0ABU2RWX6_9ACTN|nr:MULTISPECIES: hypothetical protein [unclassified Streptomyces]MDT0441246.1 hypothetical protein [Streptomyces sp. DSM 41886]ONK11074.1 hypothetical protein STBA_18020 [Streptomyces sp. MP131-18]